MSKTLSIAMPSLLHRVGRSTMYSQIEQQTKDLNNTVEFLCLMDNGPLSTGSKLNTLFSLCRGDYITLLGDDDSLEPDFVSSLLEAINEHDVDLITFDHSYSVDGGLVSITKQIPGCREQEHPGSPEEHHRLPGPLCPVRSDIAKKFRHPDLSDREDVAYKQFLKENTTTHFNIDRVLYHHLWNSGNKRERDGLKWMWGRH